MPFIFRVYSCCMCVGGCNRELVSQTSEEAADIPIRLLNDPGFREQQHRLCGERAKAFRRMPAWNGSIS